MDWLVIGTVAIGAWVLLLNLSGERISQSQRLAVALAQAAARASANAAANSENEIPIAASAESSLAGSPGAFNRKR